LNIDELISALKQAFPKDDPRPEQLRNILLDFEKVQRLQQSLYEWKELHNSLDDILTSFAPFSSEIHRADSEKTIPSLSTLNNLWYAVTAKVDALLEFARNIKYIGNRYKEEAGMTSGETWAVKISGLRNQVNIQLGLNETSSFNVSTKRSISFAEKSKLMIGIRPDWWVALYELNNEFNHVAYGQMHWADKKLRETATELYTLSKSAFGSDNEQL
jgi:hypothetical protein